MDTLIFHLQITTSFVVSVMITNRSVSSQTTVSLFLSLKIFIAVLQISTSASAGACRQANPDSSKYSERRSMNLCLLPELDTICDFLNN